MILFSKFNINTKYYSAYLQAEVIISLALLVISIAATSYGWSFFYQQQYSRRAFSALNRTLIQLSRQLDANACQWNVPENYTPENLTPLPQVQAEYFTSVYTLDQLASNYQIDIYSNLHNVPIYFFIAKNNLSVAGIEFEQIYFYGCIHHRGKWMYASTTKIYEKPAS